MVEYHSIVDKVYRFSVVVDDNYRICILIELIVFNKILIMCINDNQEIVCSYLDCSICWTYKEILTGGFFDHINEMRCKTFLVINRDISFLTEKPYSTCESAGSAYSIEIAETMPHDIYLAAVTYKLL